MPHARLPTARRVAAAALASVADTLVGLVEVRSPEDIAYREQVSEWARDALRARRRSELPPPLPVRTTIAEPEAPRQHRGPGRARRRDPHDPIRSDDEEPPGQP